jgi:phosphatidylglycerol:prolipoprotein diacylglycerol transferase
MYPIFLKLGSVTIRFYGVMMAAAFIAGICIARKESVRKGLSREYMLDFASYAVISGIAGARLYYVVLHSGYFWGQPLDIVKLWQGGLAFHGGILGGFLAGIWFTKKRKIPFWKFADALAPGIILAQAIGRVGCFLNGCCYGRETAVPWAVTFRHPESSALLNVPLHPTQLYEMAGNLGIFFFLWSIRGRNRIGLTIWSPRFKASARRDEGSVPSAAHNREATPQWPKDGTPRRARLLLGCDCVAHRLRSALTTRRSSLLVSLQNHLWQIVNPILLRPLRKKKMPDGYVFLLYAITYSGLRFGIEFFRADSLYPGGLSLAWAHVMAVVTVVAALICMRRGKKIGKEKKY